MRKPKLRDTRIMSVGCGRPRLFLPRAGQFSPLRSVSPVNTLSTGSAHHIPFPSPGSSQSRDWTQVSCICRQILHCVSRQESPTKALEGNTNSIWIDTQGPTRLPEHPCASMCFGMNGSPYTRASKRENLGSKCHWHTLDDYFVVSAKARLYEPTDTHRRMTLKNLNCTKEERKLSIWRSQNQPQECETKADSQKQGLYSALTLQRAQQTGKEGQQPASGNGWFQMLHRCSHLVFLSRIKS